MVNEGSEKFGPKDFAKNVRNRIGLAVSSAFALVIGLVWLDVINAIVKDIIDYFKLTGTGLVVKIVAATLTTVICVVGILYFSKWSEKKT